jgi:hypothetical protein
MTSWVSQTACLQMCEGSSSRCSTSRLLSSRLLTAEAGGIVRMRYSSRVAVSCAGTIVSSARVVAYTCFELTVCAACLSAAPRKEELLPLVTEAPVKLRPGAKLMLQRLARLGVPVLVVSAGCTELIEQFLEAQGALHANMHVSSNSLVWDEASGDVCRVLPEPPGEHNSRSTRWPAECASGSLHRPWRCAHAAVTSLNKELTHSRNADLFDRHRDRCNLLVLGDRCSDLKVRHAMARMAVRHAVACMQCRASLPPVSPRALPT